MTKTMNTNTKTDRRLNLLAENNITASVTLDWDKTSNPNCKFEPGDQVMVRKYINTRNLKSKNKRALRGAIGRVIAASTINGFNLTNSLSHRRGHTNYYVVFSGNKVAGFQSYMLQ